MEPDMSNAKQTLTSPIHIDGARDVEGMVLGWDVGTLVGLADGALDGTLVGVTYDVKLWHISSS